MDRVFLDANVVFSAAYLVATHLHGLWKLAEATLITSDYAVEEARRRLSPQARDRLDSLPLPPGLLLPDKDVPIFLAARTTGASHLLTGYKRHFGADYGQTFQGVLILPPSDYLRHGR